MVNFKSQINKITNKYKKQAIYFLAIPLLTHISLAYSADPYLIDPKAQGRLGNYIGKVGSFTTPSAPTYDVDYNAARGLLTISAVTGTRGNGIGLIPGTSVYGIILVNERQQASSGKIYLAVNGGFSSQYTDSSGRETRFGGTLNNSAFTSSFSSQWLTPTDTGLLAWGPFPQSSYNVIRGTTSWNANLNVSSYTVYASGSLLPGKYVLQYGEMKFNRNSPNSDGNRSTTILSDSDLGIYVLRQCTLIADKSTAITFDNQVGQITSGPKLLNAKDLGLIVNCPNGGNASIYIKPRSSLVSGSTTGMNLTKVGGNSAKKLPYVTVTGQIASDDSICASNNGSAFKYNELNQLTNNSAKDFQQNIYFNLCANGEVIPGKYQGAIDVEIMVE